MPDDPEKEPDDIISRPADDSVRRFRRTGVSILLSDLDLALTFVKIATTGLNHDTRQRNLEHARKAYDAIGRFLPRVDPTPEEKAAIDEKLSQLKGALEVLGRSPVNIPGGRRMVSA